MNSKPRPSCCCVSESPSFPSLLQGAKHFTLAALVPSYAPKAYNQAVESVQVESVKHNSPLRRTKQCSLQLFPRPVCRYTTEVGEEEKRLEREVIEREADPLSEDIQQREGRLQSSYAGHQAMQRSRR